MGDIQRSKMFLFLKDSYNKNKIGINELNTAVINNWITEEEKNIIINGGD